jgi:hypothetical protein
LQLEAATLLGRRHASGDFFDESIEGVPGFFKPGVHASRAGIDLRDRGTFGNREREVRQCQLDRPIIGEVATGSTQDESVVELESLADRGRCFDPSDLDLVDVGTESALLRLGEERGLARLAVFAREPVRSQPANGRRLPDKYTPPVLSDNPAFGAELLDRLPRSHPRDAIVLPQLGLGRKPIAWPKLTCVDRGTEVISNLSVGRPIA